MNSTNYPAQPSQSGENPGVINDSNEDYVLEQLREEIEGIKAEISETERPGLAEKLGFKKQPQKAIISVENDHGATSSMNEIIHPSPELKEALSLALDAAPIDAYNPVLDERRPNEATRVTGALAERAQALSGTVTPEAEVVHKQGGHATLLQGERLITPIEAVRDWTREVVAARNAVAGGSRQ